MPDSDSSENGAFSITPSEIEALSFKPFPHQVEAISYGLDPEHEKWLNLSSMGLGKTLEIIGLAETLKRRGLIERCLIVCGVDSLRQNWKREIGRFSSMGCRVLGEKVSAKGNVTYAKMEDRAKEIKAGIPEFFVIVNAATLRSDAVIDALRKREGDYGMIAVDEIHRFATATSQQGANLLKLRAKYKVGATGTMLINSPLSCYVPLKWTENDWSTLTNFKSAYCEFGGFQNHQIVGYKNLDALRDQIESCSIRKTLDQVRDDMPPKTVTYELVEPSDEHRRFYEAIVAGVKSEADKIKLNASNLLALTTRLRQATSCPSALTSQRIKSTKLERCEEIVRDLAESGEKVVVMSNFKDAVYELAESLADLNPLVGTGDEKDQDVQIRVDSFQSDPAKKVFLATAQKIGTGYTLNAASYCVMIDTAWTDASFQQACDRIWRVNNDRPAFITVLECRDTIDERVREIVESKKSLADYVIDGADNGVAEDSLAKELRRIIAAL